MARRIDHLGSSTPACNTTKVHPWLHRVAGHHCWAIGIAGWCRYCSAVGRHSLRRHSIARHSRRGRSVGHCGVAAERTCGATNINWRGSNRACHRGQRRPHIMHEVPAAAPLVGVDVGQLLTDDSELLEELLARRHLLEFHRLDRQGHHEPHRRRLGGLHLGEGVAEHNEVDASSRSHHRSTRCEDLPEGLPLPSEDVPGTLLLILSARRNDADP
mmetsp:Transcript_41699/g.107974  ORF Transcript_41699/g.107974 Transcript_41699/m.107974 type:complete len:215 (+) Transcript_41699:144-788(+)